MVVKRQFFHYLEWEEHHSGMWRKVSKQEEERLFKECVDFTGDHVLYGSWMIKALSSWPVSCAQNLSDVSINRQAWIGHAACCLAINAPEYLVRRAWWQLSESQRTLANQEADKAILVWEQSQQGKEPCQENQLVLMF